MKKIMGIDIGEKRIGIAVSDSLGYTAQGVETYARIGEGDAAYIATKMEELGASVVVAGLPLNMNGSEGPAVQNVREFAAQLNALGVEVDFRMSG